MRNSTDRPPVSFRGGGGHSLPTFLGLGCSKGGIMPYSVVFLSVYKMVTQWRIQRGAEGAYAHPLK